MRQQGFTIVELMIVVTLMGIIAALAMPGFISTFKNHKLRSATDDYYAAIRYARAEAVRSRSVITVEPLALGDNNRWIEGVEVKDSAGEVLRHIRIEEKDIEEPEITAFAHLESSPNAGLSSLTFNPKGFLNSNEKVLIDICDGRLTTNLQARRVELLISGFAAVKTRSGC